jgi:hypothetical protein
MDQGERSSARRGVYHEINKEVSSSQSLVVIFVGHDD